MHELCTNIYDIVDNAESERIANTACFLAYLIISASS